MKTTKAERHLHSRTCNQCGETKTGDLMRGCHRDGYWRIDPRCLDCHRVIVKGFVRTQLPVFEPTEPATKEELHGEDAPFVSDARHEAYCNEHREMQGKLYKISLAQLNIKKVGQCKKIDLYLAGAK